MALNRFMHPRNPYKNNRPDFKKLALEHEEFRQAAKQNLDGSISLDFKSPTSLRALCKVLLKSDFGLAIDLPADRLVPAIPQRLNYLLWIEDILNANAVQVPVCGIDVGCGASCIYALLGHKTNEWKFVVTEKDPLNLKFSRENIERNKFNDAIKVLEADNHILKSAVEYYEDLTKSADDSSSYKQHMDFCMCNPPFFDMDESRSCRDERKEPKHLSTASSVESSCSGGEVEFVKTMIDESLLLKDKIRIYTSMLGKKSSLSKIKQYLREKGVASVSSTEFCQGRTMRWAVAWSFQSEISYPKSLFRLEKSQGGAGFSHVIKPELLCCQYDVPSLTEHIHGILHSQLKMTTVTLNQDITEYVCIVSARSNTWSHNRRKRRQEKRNQEENLSASVDDKDTPTAKRQKLDANTSTASVEVENSSDENEAPPIITFSLEIKFGEGQIKLNVKLIDGDQKDTLHQILQYIKNRLV